MSSESFDQAYITQYIKDNFAGVDVMVASQENGAPEIAWGDTFFSYDPEQNLPAKQRFPFATIVTKDYTNFDTASDLNRPGVFRFNIGVGKETFLSLFGTEDATYNFAALDQVMPHPVYGRMYWLCVLNPSKETFQQLQPLLAEAYQLAVKRQIRRE